MKFLRKNKAFTLLETTIAITILVILFTLVSKTFLQFMKTYQYFLVRNEVYDETHFLFEEMIKKMRNSNIDYQSYWRENTRIKTSWDIRVVDQWSSQWANPQWASANLSSWWNFNSNPDHDTAFLDYIVHQKTKICGSIVFLRDIHQNETTWSQCNKYLGGGYTN